MVQVGRIVTRLFMQMTFSVQPLVEMP